MRSNYNDAHYDESEHYKQSDHKDGRSYHMPGDFAHIASTDETKLRLMLLVDERIDINKDGNVQLDELAQWLQQRQDKYSQEDADRHWSTFHRATNDLLSWKDYSNQEYEHFEALLKQSGSREQMNAMKKSHEYHIQRDSRRWKAADLNRDGQLSRREFKIFLHPEYSEQMHGLVVEEKFDLFDRDHDRRISFEEFISNLTPDELNHEPEKREAWAREQKSIFHSRLDLDHDNYLNKAELASWVTKSELREQSIKEAQQLMQAADSNRDHRLTKEEILASYYEFINSHATDFGELLREPSQPIHEEL